MPGCMHVGMFALMCLRLCINISAFGSVCCIAILKKPMTDSECKIEN